MSTTAIIRQRGQLTIPGDIRETLAWISTGSVVSLATVDSNKILIQPLSASKGTINWDKLRWNIELARSYKGTYKGNLSKFIAQDREKRR